MEETNLITKKFDSSVAKEDKDNNEAENLIKATKEERNSMPYITASSCNPIGVVVPTKLSYETVEALSVFTNNNIDTAEYVKAKLKYRSRLDVCDAFAAEQVDALALAINQIESNKGFILGDMAGIGKGRVVAGVCRYAKQVGKTPVFITTKPSLFTDIYRDFSDIGGLNGIPNNFNDNDLPKPFILNTDKEAEIKKDLGEEVITLFKPFSAEITKEFCLKKTMPKNIDVIILTYSQLGMNVNDPKNANAIAKFDFLKALAPNSVFVLDESHIGASEGNAGKNLELLISLVSGIMFASATYSKVPKSMRMYIPKTDIAKSNINPKTVVDAVRDNGEAVQEYIASLLVKSGQMIRRERTFDKCRIDYNYIKKDVQKYYNLYDTVMELYNEIENFSKGKGYEDAIEKAIERFTKEQGVAVVFANDPKPNRDKKPEYTEWCERNKNKYTVTFNPRGSVKNRFQWIENLLFSIKADFVSQEVIKLLTDKTVINERGEIVPNLTEYTEGDKKYTLNVNYKPIIAVRNTAESSINGLGYKSGQKISKEENDYARTLIKIATSLVTSTLKFIPVSPSATRKLIEVENATIQGEDFADGGITHKEIVAKMSSISTGLPLSPIDYMIDMIESTKRPIWDYDYSSSDNFKVEEITKRQLSIRKKGDEFEIVPIKKGSVAEKISNFNSGKSDVVIINTAGSTGISLHSKGSFFDKRPRAMIIHQVELDVNTEVQKRGRINRTGQVNNPAYAYVVSCIPSEIRKLLMFRRKLRSLDANTTGNLKQSARSSEILDSKGKIIEDMANKYGYQVLMSYIKEAGNERFDNLIKNEFWTEASQTDEEKFETYLREIEKIPCIDQEVFYNEMNDKYIVHKNFLEENGEWDLDTSIEDLRTSTRNKKAIYIGNNENEFTKSVYIEDKFVTPKGKPYTKEELFERMDFLSSPFGGNYTKYHDNLLEDYDAYTNSILTKLKESYGDADTSLAETEEEIQEIVNEHTDMVERRVANRKEELDEIRRYLEFFKPNNVVRIPVEVDMLRDGAYDDRGNIIQGITPKIGKFVGYKLLKKSDATFTPMNIELEFASISKMKPHLKITLTPQYRGIIDYIIESRRFDQIEIVEVDGWIIKKSGERENMRVLTGEIFKAFELSNDVFAQDPNYNRRKRLIKYTTSAGTVETGIKLFLNRNIQLTSSNQPIFAPINSDAFKEMVNKASRGEVIFLRNKKDFIIKYGEVYSLNFCTGQDKTQSGGERRTPQKEYISPYATQENADLIKKATGLGTKFPRNTMTMYVEGSPKRVREMMFMSFEGSKDKLSELLDFMYKAYGLIEEVKNIGEEGEFIIREMADAYVEGADNQSEEGEYQYHILNKFDENTVPPNYIADSYKEVEGSQYGVITLRYPLTVSACMSYGVVPANITQTQAVRNILNSIKDDKSRLDYISAVKKLKDDYIEIAQLTTSTILVNPKYAIGNVTPKYAGKIIADNIDNPAPQEVEAQIESQGVDVFEALPLNFKSAEDFVIKLKSL